MRPEETSEAFWRSQSRYPNYKFIKSRRLFEVNHIASRLADMHFVERFCDIGCGDGSLVRCLDEVMNVKEFFCCDFSEGLLAAVPTGDRFTSRRINLNDRTQHRLIKSGGVVNLGACLNYVFDDEVVVDLLNSLQWDRLFVRAVCSEKGEQETVNKFSENLESDYACIYRTRERMEELMSAAGMGPSSGLLRWECFRVYPDQIESEFGTKQYMFHCVR